jgi:murein tripeptide amidase MpaA
MLYQMVALIEYLLEEYTGGNVRIASLLNTTDIHIMPTVNPDGFASSRKGLCQGVDVLSCKDDA